MSNIVWATASGIWQTASIWNFWNEETQQAEPYGRSPQNGDTVYLNGFTVTSTSNINIGNGLITNDANDTYGIIAGGQLTMNMRGWTITANLFAKQDHLINSNTTQQTALESIIGNVENDDGYVIYYSGSYTGTWVRNININGNIHLRNQDMNYYTYQNTTSFPTVSTVTITGNIVIDNPSKKILANRNVTDRASVGGNMTGGKISDNINNFVLGGKLTQTAQQGSIATATFSNEVEILDGAYLSGTTVNLNDNLIIHDGSYLAFTTVNFNKVDGIVKIGHNSRFSATTHNFVGRKIEYYDDSMGVCGITVGTTSRFAPTNADFQWVNLSEPRTLKYIILTDADMNNTNQYPSPSNVKKDIPYAFNQMVGTYDINQYLPPETVVLKDYVYDGGEMVGTYEGGGTVQNTINVYPYKRRNH